MRAHKHDFRISKTQDIPSNNRESFNAVRVTKKHFNVENRVIMYLSYVFEEDT